MNRSKAIGTQAETAVVRYLQNHGWASAERRALAGIHDQGDIAGTPGVCWEVKSRKKAVGDEDIAGWMVETEVERGHAGAELGILVVRRPGYGPARAGRWWAYMQLDDLIGRDASMRWQPGWDNVADAPVRFYLADAVTLLRTAGYGTPIGGAA